MVFFLSPILTFFLSFLSFEGICCPSFFVMNIHYFRNEKKKKVLFGKEKRRCTGMDQYKQPPDNNEPESCLMRNNGRTVWFLLWEKERLWRMRLRPIEYWEGRSRRGRMRLNSGQLQRVELGLIEK